MNHDLSKKGFGWKSGMIIFGSCLLSAVIGGTIGYLFTIIYSINEKILVSGAVAVFGEVMGFTLISRFGIGIKSFAVGILGGIVGAGNGAIVCLLLPFQFGGLLLAVGLTLLFSLTIALLWLDTYKTNLDNVLLRLRWFDFKKG
jgi:hypothetical protein